MTEPDVEPVDADPRWNIEEDHPLHGQEVTVEVGDREVTGRIGEVELFRGRRRACPRSRTRHRRGLQRRARSAGVLTSEPTPYRYNGADRTDPANRTGQSTAAARWRGSTRRLGTLPLFSPSQYNVCPHGEPQLCPGRPPRRAGATIQDATMTLRRDFGTTGSNSPSTSPSLSTRSGSATSRGSSPTTVEEESPRKSVTLSERVTRRTRIPGREWIQGVGRNMSVRVGAFNTLHYCYHSDDTLTHTPGVSATSHVVAPSPVVESGGVSA